MNLNRPGKLYPDGVFVFDEPVKVRVIEENKITFAHGYTTKCSCGECVYIDPWVCEENDGGYAIRSWGLQEH